MANFLTSCFLLGVAAALLPAQQSAENGYGQPYRPQFHFSPQQNWTNDPNGLVYFKGEYHLFFQFNPFGDEWGHMSWGHAVSPDLLHWKELPVAIPEENGIMIFTGSTVVDEHNSSGFCKNNEPCLVAIYTGHTPAANGVPALQTQNLAFSNDRGRSWTKFSGNPVLNLHMSDFRDPKVLWSSEARHWVMAVSLPNDHKVRFYGSPDLRHWTALSDFGPAGATGGQWECPELFQVGVEGSPKKKWVLKVGLNPDALEGGSGEQYFVGDFDGSKFTNGNPSSHTLWTDYGKDCYCALTFNGLPASQKPVMIGWMDNWQYAAKLPTSPWRGQMTFPRNLALRQTSEGLQLVQSPYDGIAQLAASKEDLRETGTVRTHTFFLHSVMNISHAQQSGWRLLADSNHHTLVGYDSRKHRLFVDRTQSGLTGFSRDFPARMEAPLTLSGVTLTLDILVDQSSIEVFADNGRVTSTNLIFPPEGANRIEVFANGGKAELIEAHVSEMKSIWVTSNH